MTHEEAIKHKKCRVCGNPRCPYPGDEDYARALRGKWGGNPDNKECWIPIGTDPQKEVVRRGSETG
ncbi:MAG: hypothetical protein AB1426_12625 [Bacillota bacterium]